MENIAMRFLYLLVLVFLESLVAHLAHCFLCHLYPLENLRNTNILIIFKIYIYFKKKFSQMRKDNI